MKPQAKPVRERRSTPCPGCPVDECRVLVRVERGPSPPGNRNEWRCRKGAVEATREVK